MILRMYRPVQFREDRLEVLTAAIREQQFATLVSVSDNRLVASHIPMLLKDEATGMRLEGHVARGNPQWKQVDATIDALAIFVGPQSYVSPAWYASKAEHQRVVPTWNYISVQAAGPLTVMDDKEWLLKHVEELTDHNESGRDEPWSIHDAPEGFIEQLSSGIVGLSLQVRRLEGAWKMAQHRPEGDRLGVIKGLAERGDAAAQSVALEMLRLENERSK